MAELDLKNYTNRHSLKVKIARVVWGICWFLIFRWMPTGFRLSRYVRIGLLKLFGAQIGHRSTVHGSAKVWQPWKLKMGRQSTIGSRVDCYAVDEIIIGDQVTVSQDVFLCTASHDITSPTMELTTASIVLEDQSWIGARAIILPGVRIGEGAVVGAGAVVAKDVEAWSVVCGNPAREVGTRIVSFGEVYK